MKKSVTQWKYIYRTFPINRTTGSILRISIIILTILTFFSCNSIPSKKINTENTVDKPKTNNSKMEEIGELSPQPGDIKTIDGVEYIYASNRKYMLTPYEPEYVWERKDRYVPRLGENLIKDKEREKEQKLLETRIANFEESLKKKSTDYRSANLSDTVFAKPVAVKSTPGTQSSKELFSSKMKRRVMILPIKDETNYKKHHFNELVEKTLVSKLENTDIITCVNPVIHNLEGKLTDHENMIRLNDLYGIQAVIEGTISDIAIGSSSIFTIGISVYDTETGSVLNRFSDKGSLIFDKSIGDLAFEETKVKSINASIEHIREDLLNVLLTIEWHARIATVENNQIYINAGRLSGLENGTELEVYSPGKEIFDSKTKKILGRTKGDYKGKIRVSDLFGVDASMAKPVKGGNFSPSDLVYAKIKENL